MKKNISKYNHLKIISGVKFTPREIDVIACLLSGKGSKTIAKFLSIEEKTLETHKYNIMRKLERNSKEGIIEFIEKSDKFAILKNHYASLLRNDVFEKHLRQIFSLSKNKDTSCVLIYEEDKDNIYFLNELEKHLKCAGIKTHGHAKENHRLNLQINSPKVDSIVYLVSESFIEELDTDDDQTKIDVDEIKQKILSDTGKIVFLSQNKEPLLHFQQTIQDAEYIDFGTQEEDYFSSFFKILQIILPNVDVKKIALEFKNHYKDFHNSYDHPLSTHKVDIDTNELELLNHTGKTHDYSLITQKKTSIKSDLNVPTESTLLNRHEIVSQIENALNGDAGIETVALVGIGGAGKTTIARHYALNQEGPVVWEINAETHENLAGSFENLAYALSQSEEEKKILRGLLEITNPKDKEDKVILFVKDKLKSQANWLLIYDNVEKFADIQKYFPFSVESWGKGKIIITSRDSNIQYNNHIKTTISIGELDIHDRVTLFKNIMLTNHASQFDHMKPEQIVFFLNHIPPFPLDVSIAAYYLKATNLPYSIYIAHLNGYNKDLDTMQQDIIKEVSQYQKTRYSIITLSLDCFLKANKDFKELLLLVSLIDSQNIPKDILNAYKNEIVVESFIYHLRKYSLTVCSPADEFHSTPYLTIHRSTQGISLAYLLKRLNIQRNPDFIEPIVKIIEKYASKIFDSMEFLKIVNLKSHCEMFLSHDKLLNSRAKALIEGVLGAIHYNLGYYKSAIIILRNCLEELSSSKLNKQESWLKVLVYLGMTYRKLGNYKKAKEVIEQCVSLYKNDFPDNHLEYLWALGNLGTTYKYLGNYNKAKVIFEESLQIYKEHFDKLYIGNAWALVNLGNIFRNLGNYDSAQQLLEQGIEIYKKNLPKNHTEIAWAFVQLGDIYRSLGRYAEATKIFMESLRIYEEQFGNDHIETACILAYLGRVYREAAYHEKAINLLMKNQNNQLQSSIDKDSLLKISSHLIVNTAHEDKIKKILEESLVAHDKHYGKNHTATARIMIYLGEHYKDFGNLKEAESLFIHSLKIYNDNFGINHVKTARAHRGLGEVYYLQGNLEIAEVHISNSLKIFDKLKHPERFKALECLSALWLEKSLKSKNIAKSQHFKILAIDDQKRALSVAKTYFPANSPHIIRLQAKLNTLQRI